MCRYLDITLGLLLTVSMLCLLYGSFSLHPTPLILFFTLSLTVVLSYWLWYFYTVYIIASYPVFEEHVSLKVCKSNFIYILYFSDWQNWLFTYFDLLDIAVTSPAPLQRPAGSDPNTTQF